LEEKEKYLLQNKYGQSRHGRNEAPKTWKEEAKLDTMAKI